VTENTLNVNMPTPAKLRLLERLRGMGVEYFNTFGGNPVSAAAAGLAVMDVLEDESLQQQALSVGDILPETTIQKILEIFRGNGLFLGIDIVESLESRTPAAARTSFICTRLEQDYHIS
jgi:4-aminobutyrate aminotransferase-like enzyme